MTYSTLNTELEADDTKSSSSRSDSSTNDSESEDDTSSKSSSADQSTKESSGSDESHSETNESDDDGDDESNNDEEEEKTDTASSASSSEKNRNKNASKRSAARRDEDSEDEDEEDDDDFDDDDTSSKDGSRTENSEKDAKSDSEKGEESEEQEDVSTVSKSNRRSLHKEVGKEITTTANELWKKRKSISKQKTKTVNKLKDIASKIKQKESEVKTSVNKEFKKVKKAIAVKKDKKDSSSEESDSSDDGDEFEEMDDENPTTWRHAALVEDQIQLEKSLKSMHTKGSGVNVKKRIYTVIDPLGLRNDITDFVSNSHLKINPNVEGFLPSKYLAIVHRSSEERLLSVGKERMVKCIDEITDDMKKLVQTHLGRFIYCKDNLEEIVQQTQQVSTTSPSSGRSRKMSIMNQSSHNSISHGIQTEQFQMTWFKNMDMSFKHLQDMTQLLFDPMIQLRSQEKSIQQMLSIVERLLFVLNIPSLMEQSISQENFKQAVQYYKKAQFLMQGTKSSLFQKVYLDGILSQVTQTREKLLSILDIHPDISNSSVMQLGEITAQKIRIIDYLYDFDCETDPATFHLKSYQSFILSQLHQWSNRKEPLSNAHNEEQESTDDLSADSKSTSRHQVQSPTEKDEIFSKVDNNCVEQLSTVNQLCEVMEYHIPDLVIYCIEYSKRTEKRMKLDAMRLKAFTQTKRFNQKQIEEHRKQREMIEKQYMDDIFSQIFIVFSFYVNNVIDGVDNGTVEQPLFIKSVLRISDCIFTLMNTVNEKTISSIFSNLLDFGFNLLVSTIDKLFEYSIKHVKCLHAYHYGPEADWRVFSTSAEKPNCTKVQILFQKILEVTQTNLSRLLPILANLGEYSNQIIASFDNLVIRWRDYLIELFLSYSDVIHHSMMQLISIAVRNETRSRSRNVKKLNFTMPKIHSVSALNDQFSLSDMLRGEKEQNRKSGLDAETRIILLLSNCSNCLVDDGIIQKMIDKYLALITATLNRGSVNMRGVGQKKSDQEPEDSELNADMIKKKKRKLRKRYTSDAETSSDESSDDSTASSSSLSSYGDSDNEHQNAPDGKLSPLSHEELSSEVWKSLKTTYETLKDMLIDAYIQGEIRRLNRLVSQSASIQNQKQKADAIFVRPYLIELMNELVRVHYQFELFGLGMAKQVIFSKLLERIMELMLDHVRVGVDVSSCDTQFKLILQLEVDYLTDCFQNFLTNHSMRVIQKLNQWIEDCCPHPGPDQKSDVQTRQAMKATTDNRLSKRKSQMIKLEPVTHSAQLKTTIQKTRLQYNLFRSE